MREVRFGYAGRRLGQGAIPQFPIVFSFLFSAPFPLQFSFQIQFQFHFEFQVCDKFLFTLNVQFEHSMVIIYLFIASILFCIVFLSFYIISNFPQFALLGLNSMPFPLLYSHVIIIFVICTNKSKLQYDAIEVYLF
jgi:hypothetical protein